MNVLFIPFNLKSHIISTFGLADILKRNGYCVTIASSGEYLELVNSNSFFSYELNGFPYGYGFEKINRKIFENSENVYLDDLIDRISNRIYIDRYEKINLMINILKPKIIFIDVFCSTDLIILLKIFKNTKIKIAFFQGSFKNFYSFIIPSVDCPYNPSQKIKTISFCIIKNLGFYSRMIYEYFKYLTHSDFSIIRKSLKNCKNINISKTRFHRIHFHDYDYFIFCYEELEFNRVNSNHFHYIGNGNKLNFLKTYNADNHWITLINTFENKKKIENKKIIYFSIGTILSQTYEIEGEIYNFIQQVLNLSEFENLIIICSLGKISKMFDNKSNLFIYENVLQNELLKIVDVFISHGGTGSISESILSEVPMLLYDFGKIYDQKGNISKCLHYKLALTGNYKKETTDTINFKINLLLEDYTYRQNIKNLNLKIRQNSKYTEEEILDKIWKLKQL